MLTGGVPDGAIARAPQARGLSLWILKDFRSPRRFHDTYQDYWNRKGLVDETGRRKQAFDVLREFYRDDTGRGMPDAAAR